MELNCSLDLFWNKISCSVDFYVISIAATAYKIIFTESAYWADSVSKSQCPWVVRLCVQKPCFLVELVTGDKWQMTCDIRLVTHALWYFFFFFFCLFCYQCYYLHTFRDSVRLIFLLSPDCISTEASGYTYNYFPWTSPVVNFEGKFTPSIEHIYRHHSSEDDQRCPHCPGSECSWRWSTRTKRGCLWGRREFKLTWYLTDYSPRL